VERRSGGSVNMAMNGSLQLLIEQAKEEVVRNIHATVGNLQAKTVI